MAALLSAGATPSKKDSGPVCVYIYIYGVGVGGSGLIGLTGCAGFNKSCRTSLVGVVLLNIPRLL